MGRWFVQGHDATAAAALRAVEELRLPHQLVSAGFGPERSVVEAAVREAGWVRCAGCAYVGPPASHTCTGDQASSSPEPGVGQEHERTRPGRATALLAESGAARGRWLPGAADPTWTTVPLHLRQHLLGRAQALVSPARGPLAARENRHLLSAMRAAARMRMTGAHWILLLTTDRRTFGPRSQRAQALYGVLEQVAAQYAVPAEDEAAGPVVGPR